MNVTIIDNSGIHPSIKDVEKFLELVSTSIMDFLNIHRINKDLVISVEPYMEDTGLTAMKDKNTILMALNADQSVYGLAITLAHELVHVKQYATGLLRTGPEGSNFWRGKQYDSSTPYLDCPWEIQAFSQQELLARRALET